MTTPGVVVGATGVFVGAEGVPLSRDVVAPPPRAVVPERMVDAEGVLMIVVTTTLLEYEMVVTPVLEVGTGAGMVVILTLGKGTPLLGTIAGVVSVQGTSVVYVLVTMTGAGVETLIVQGQAKDSQSCAMLDTGLGRNSKQLTQGDRGLRSYGISSV